MIDIFLATFYLQLLIVNKEHPKMYKSNVLEFYKLAHIDLDF